MLNNLPPSSLCGLSWGTFDWRQKHDKAAGYYKGSAPKQAACEPICLQFKGLHPLVKHRTVGKQSP